MLFSQRLYFATTLFRLRWYKWIWFMFVYLMLTLVIVFSVLFALRRVLLLRSDIRLSTEWYCLTAVEEANRISLRRSRNITFAKAKISRRTKWGISLKNNENAVVLCFIKFESICDRRDRACPCPQFISNSICASAPSLRGLSFFRRKKRLGEFL